MLEWSFQHLPKKGGEKWHFLMRPQFRALGKDPPVAACSWRGRDTPSDEAEEAWGMPSASIQHGCCRFSETGGTSRSTGHAFTNSHESCSDSPSGEVPVGGTEIQRCPKCELPRHRLCLDGETDGNGQVLCRVQHWARPFRGRICLTYPHDPVYGLYRYCLFIEEQVGEQEAECLAPGPEMVNANAWTPTQRLTQGPSSQTRPCLSTSEFSPEEKRLV